MDDLDYAIRKRMKSLAKRYLSTHPPVSNMPEAERLLVTLLINADRYARKDQIRQDSGKELNDQSPFRQGR